MFRLPKKKKASSDYADRVTHQIKQFSNMEALSKLPPIYFYWMSNFIKPRIEEVFGVNNALPLYVNTFKDALSLCSSNRIISIGSGDCNLEIEIAKSLLKSGVGDFVVECVELSEERLSRGREKAASENLLNHIKFKVCDVNSDISGGKYAGIMAHHVLHHIVELETLFNTIHELMEDNSRFVSIDIIGRNGHMRHPEALDLVEKIWRCLPDSYKFNHQFKKIHKDFVNWDCSNKGFEGVRAEEILRLLIENFSFERFLAYGNLTDPFIERGYGHNFDVDQDRDKALIEFIHTINDLLIDLGYLKPTMMFAILRKKSVQLQTKVFKHWTPEFCLRKTN
jgi:SAM-dependent methyltransferase